jgi:hypothetical protein
MLHNHGDRREACSGRFHADLTGTQGIDNRIPARQSGGHVGGLDRSSEGELAVACEQFLGGLLNSYYRKAA